MLNEDLITFDVIKTAIKMEVDGKTFYIKAAGLGSNKLEKIIFNSLAAEEDAHRQVFEKIYQAISNGQQWPAFNLYDNIGKIKTLVAREIRQIGTGIKAASTELDAVKTAMGLEDKTFDYYKSNSEKATYPAEKELYQKLASQEASHKLVLADYYEYLSSPSAYFVKKEHHSLDGG